MAETKMLEAIQPNPAWDATSYPGVVDTLAAADCTFKVWGGDWCGDCRGQLPDFAATLDAAGVSVERVDHYPIEKTGDGPRVGPLVREYDIGLIPTVVVERDGEEVARFVKEEDVPIAVYLADELSN